MAKSNEEDEGRKIPIHVERNTTYYRHICNAKTKGVGARAKGIKKRTWGIKEVTMITKDKQLLLQDLCARLPYGVKVSIEYSEGKYTHIYNLREIDNDTTSESRQYVTVWNYGFYSSVISYPLIDCRPYLRPMSSMTEEEKLMYEGLMIGTDNVSYMSDVIDWLNTHHFDYRGLIPKGLAISTEVFNPYED